MDSIHGFRPATPESPIVVFRALPGLGDFLCIVPTLRALRHARPGAEIHLIGLPGTRGLAERFAAYVDQFHVFPGHPCLPEQPDPGPAARAQFSASIRALAPALALQLHGSGEVVNEIVLALGARAAGGFHRAGQPSPDPDRFLVWSDDEPEAQRGLRLLRALGILAGPHDGMDGLEFPLAASANRNVRELLQPLNGRRYAVVHPGSARAETRWGADGFVGVMDRLRMDGFGIVLTGTSDEAPLVRRLVGDGQDVVDVAGRTDLDTLGWVLRGASLLVANDTGVVHLGAALGVPSVVVFTTDDPGHVRRWAPLDATRHLAVPANSEQVLRAIDRLLTTEGAAA